jgi:hypothetical protein
MGPAGLTAVFGMGTGVAPPVWSPGIRPAGGQAGRPGSSGSVRVTPGPRPFWGRGRGASQSWRVRLWGVARYVQEALWRRGPHVEVWVGVVTAFWTGNVRV